MSALRRSEHAPSPAHAEPMPDWERELLGPQDDAAPASVEAAAPAAEAPAEAPAPG